MKRRWAVFLCCIVGFTLFGCGADDASPELTIAYIGDVNLLDNHLLENAQMVFKNKYPEVELTIEEQDSNDYLTQLNAELMAGKGPDLIYLSASQLDLERMARTGAYADLSDFVDHDEDLRKYSYVKAALDAGRIDGKQYLIPLNFRVWGITSSREMLDSSKIDMDHCTNLSGFLSECNQFQKAKGSEGYPYLFDKPYELWYLFDSLNGWVDYDKKTVDLERPEIREFMEFYKNCVFPAQPNLSSKNYGAAIADKEAIFGIASSSFFNDALASIGMINGYDKAEFTCLNGMDEKPFGVIDDAIVVSNTSKRKEEAYQFIQTILSYNVQVSSGSSYCWSPSICKDAWSESISAYDQGIPSEVWKIRDKSTSHRSVSVGAAPEEDVRTILNYLGEIETITLPHQDVIQLLIQQMTPYFQDKTSYEECLGKAKKRIEIYLSE